MREITPTTTLRFTSRETEIFSYMLDGLSTRQIASKLLISENTVSNHRKNMLRRSGVKHRAELLEFHQ